MDLMIKMPLSQIFLVIFPYVRKPTALIELRRRAELMRILMLALARIKAVQICRYPVANLVIHMHSYLLLIGVTVIKLEHPSNKVQVYLQNSTRKQTSKNVHECPHIPSTALDHCSHLCHDPSLRLVSTFI